LPHVFEDAIGAAQAITEAEPSLHKNAMSQEHGSLATPIRPRHPYTAAVVLAAVSPGVRLREATWREGTRQEAYELAGIAAYWRARMHKELINALGG
jgi:hypothetical protein